MQFISIHLDPIPLESDWNPASGTFYHYPKSCCEKGIDFGQFVVIKGYNVFAI